MTTEISATLAHLLAHPMLLRMIVVAGFVTVLSLICLLAVWFGKTNGSKSFANDKQSASLHSGMTLSGQR